jgi:hypothetical protein
MPEPNVLFKNGKKFYLDYEVMGDDGVDNFLESNESKFGGIEQVSIPGYRYSDTEDTAMSAKFDNRVNVPTVTMTPLGPSMTMLPMKPMAAQTATDMALQTTGEELGAIGGGALGSLAGGPLATSGGAVAGAGAGRVLGTKAADKAQEMLGLPPQDRNLVGEGFQGAVGEALGRGVFEWAPLLTRKMLRFGATPEQASKRVADLQRFGFEPQMHQVADSGIAASLKGWVAKNAFTSKAVQRSAEENVDKMFKMLDNNLKLRSATGKMLPTDPARTGAWISARFKGTPREVDRGWRTIADKKYADARSFLPYDAGVKPNTLRISLEELGDDIDSVLSAEILPAQARRVLAELNKPTRQIQIPGGNHFLQNMKIEDMRKLRTQVRMARGKTPTNQPEKARQELLGKVEEALTKNLEEGYMIHGDQRALNAFKEADKYYAIQRAHEERMFKDIAKKAGERDHVGLWRTINTAINKNDTQKLAALRNRIGGGTRQWEALQKQYIRDRLLTNAESIRFDNYTKMYDDMSDSIKALMLGAKGTDTRKYWDDLYEFFGEYGEDIAAGQSLHQKMLTRFTSAETLGPLAAAGVIGAGTGIQTENPTAGLATFAALSYMTPKAAWALVSNKKALNKIISNPSSPIVSIPGHFGRMAVGGIAMDPDEKAAAIEFMTTMMSILDTGEE